MVFATRPRTGNETGGGGDEGSSFVLEAWVELISQMSGKKRCMTTIVIVDILLRYTSNGWWFHCRHEMYRGLASFRSCVERIMPIRSELMFGIVICLEYVTRIWIDILEASNSS